ncbi:MFS transporter [Dinghuibacter silviterrae]|uniref:ACS family hexuronate transporter-like MFS transporter n=1 Tax=Dinghuibacter silviterrae TaxID=1539049 RepID=A0A4R8DGS6_9BACT|nr:MFS transporter [Dinghuibacter silviterrae]TDW96444.1 ACS family hexuronate transporter-like MFS transporter [Dinghuibacter silviterrae]
MPKTAIGKYRWTIVTLLFFATTVNYMDRQVIGLLKDRLANMLQWSEQDYSHIVMAFTASYALGLLVFGIIIDRIGSRLGYTWSIIIWSLSAMAHAFMRTTLGFGIARSALGLGESGNFPAAIKSVAEWFPKRERALATGIFNSGSNVAAILGPALIALLLSVGGAVWGVRSAFLVTGALGFLWLAFWLTFYDTPQRLLGKRVQQPEYDHILSDDEDELPAAQQTRISWVTLLGVKQTWAFFVGKLLTDPVWWFYLFWVPSYINATYHLDITKSWVYVSVIYTVASFGSILGGYLSGWLIHHKGFPDYKARKLAMFIFACCVFPIILIRFTDHVWVAVGLISLAAAAHQAWSANIFTTASDMFPKRAVSSVVGIGGMAGSLGGVVFPLITGIVLDHFKALGHLGVGYNIIFAICAVAYLLAWILMHFLCPKMVRISIKA